MNNNLSQAFAETSTPFCQSLLIVPSVPKCTADISLIPQGVWTSIYVGEILVCLFFFQKFISDICDISIGKLPSDVKVQKEYLKTKEFNLFIDLNSGLREVIPLCQQPGSASV